MWFASDGDRKALAVVLRPIDTAVGAKTAKIESAVRRVI